MKLAIRRGSAPGTALVLALLLPLPVGTARASKLRPMNIEALAQRAELIFSGRCTEARVVQDPGLGIPVTRLTFAVDSVLKGEPGPTVTLKQLHGGGPAGAAGGVIGLPQFRPGEEVLLFLYGESASGLTSPVGLGQGKFTIHTDKQGRRLAVNGFGNRNLLQGLSPKVRSDLGDEVTERDERQPIALDRLSEMIRRLRP